MTAASAEHSKQVRLAAPIYVMPANGFLVPGYVQLIIPSVWSFSNLSLVLTKSVGNFYVSKR